MRFRYEWPERVYEVNLEPSGTGYIALVEGKAFPLEVLEVLPGQITLLFGDRPITLHFAEEGDRRWVSLNGCTYLLEKPSSQGTRRAGNDVAAGLMRSPMPAQVRSIETREGMQVERGETLLLLEAMKMEIRVKAPRAGLVKKVLVVQGQTVDRDQILVEIGD